MLHTTRRERARNGSGKDMLLSHFPLPNIGLLSAGMRFSWKWNMLSQWPDSILAWSDGAELVDISISSMPLNAPNLEGINGNKSYAFHSEFARWIVREYQRLINSHYRLLLSWSRIWVRLSPVFREQHIIKKHFQKLRKQHNEKNRF